MKKLIRRWLGIEAENEALGHELAVIAEEMQRFTDANVQLARESLFKACDNSNAAEDREALEKLEARVKRIEEALVIIERKPGEPIQ